MKSIETCIFSMIQQNKEKNKDSKEFIVKVDDFYGDYLDSLLDVIAEYKNINFKKADNIEYNNLLVFTKDNIHVIENYRLCYGKTYSLVENYFKIIEMVKKLYKKNSEELPYKECKNCPYYKSGKKNIIKDILLDGEFINKNEKVSIFNNFVKIGYDTFDIRNRQGKNTVDIDNTIYEVIIEDIFCKPSKKESFCSKVKKCLKCIRN